MERKIIITENSDKSISIDCKDFTPIETMGLLRYFEKNIFVQQVNYNNKMKKQNEEKK